MSIKIPLTGTTIKASMSRFSSWCRPQQRRTLLQTLCSPTCLLCSGHLRSCITFLQKNHRLIQKPQTQLWQSLCSSIRSSQALHWVKSLLFLKSPLQSHLPLLHHVIPILSRPCDPSYQRSGQLWARISAGIDWGPCRGVVLVNSC